MHRVEVKRRMGEADIAAVSELLHLAALADGHLPLGEHQWLDLVEGRRTGLAGFVAWEPGHGHPVGYAQLLRGTNSWAVEYVVDPHHRAPDNTIGADLLRAALDEVRRQGGGHVHLWVPKPGPGHDAMAAASGLSQGRELLQMRRPLPLEEDGAAVVTRAFRPGEDEQHWLEVNNRAFAWHPEQGNWDLGALERREREPWFDPEGLLLLERDAPPERGGGQGTPAGGGTTGPHRLAGFCWTKVHADHRPALGEIYVLAVDPDFRGQGLGRQLLLSGLAWLADAGLEVAMLYVDSTNTPAVRLYRELEFTVDHVDRAYVGDLAPA